MFKHVPPTASAACSQPSGPDGGGQLQECGLPQPLEVSEEGRNVLEVKSLVCGLAIHGPLSTFTVTVGSSRGDFFKCLL